MTPGTCMGFCIHKKPSLPAHKHGTKRAGKPHSHGSPHANTIIGANAQGSWVKCHIIRHSICPAKMMVSIPRSQAGPIITCPEYRKFLTTAFLNVLLLLSFQNLLFHMHCLCVTHFHTRHRQFNQRGPMSSRNSPAFSTTRSTYTFSTHKWNPMRADLRFMNRAKLQKRHKTARLFF